MRRVASEGKADNTGYYLKGISIRLLAALLILLSCTLSAADLVTTQTDWCTITMPAKAKVGDTMTITVTLKDAGKDAEKIKVDLNAFDAERKSKGTNRSGEAQTITLGKPQIWNLTINDRPADSFLLVTVYTTKDGTWSGKVKTCNTPMMPIR